MKLMMQILETNAYRSPPHGGARIETKLGTLIVGIKTVAPSRGGAD